MENSMSDIKKIYPDPDIFKPLEGTYEYIFRERLNEFIGTKRNLIRNLFTLKEMIMEDDYKSKIDEYTSSVVNV